MEKAKRRTSYKTYTNVRISGVKLFFKLSSNLNKMLTNKR